MNWKHDCFYLSKQECLMLLNCWGKWNHSSYQQHYCSSIDKRVQGDGYCNGEI